MNTLDLPLLLESTTHIAIQAFEIVEGQKEHTKFSDKLDSTIVSEADTDTEKFIRTALKKLTPHIPVYGEELGCDGIESSPIYWLIDPIDGTAWYRMGIPLYGSLIALIQDGEPILGTIGLPGLNQLCYAAKGCGCFFWFDGKVEKLLVTSNNPKQIKNALITASGIHGTSTYIENGDTPWELLPIINEAKLFKFTGDCIQHVSVLRGKVDAAIDTIMKPWDVAPLIICLKESGAYVSDLSGNQMDILSGSTLISSRNAQLASQIIMKLQPVK